MTEAAIGLGLVLSLIFSEFFGLAAGGMVVPGYIALNLDQPVRLAVTLVAGFLTWACVRFFANFTFLYGRRRVVVTLLFGFALSRFCNEAANLVRENQMIPTLIAHQTTAIGIIIPGLLAHWMEKQGAVRTLSVMFTCAVLVRLLMMLLYPEGMGLQP